MTTFHDLNDVTQALEMLRRTRKDLPRGPTRRTLDDQIAATATAITTFVQHNTRLLQEHEAQRLLEQAAPSTQEWHAAQLTGKLPEMIAQVIAGATGSSAWAALEP